MDEEEELISKAMAALGRRTSDRKAASSAENGRKASAPEAREKMRQAQAARRERERLKREQVAQTGETE